MSNSGDAGAIADMIGQCQDGYEVQLRELDRQIEDEKRRIQKIEAQDRACKARIAQKDQLLKSIRLEKEEVFKATCEAQIEIQELSELKEGIQVYLKSQEDAIGLVQQSIQGKEFCTNLSFNLCLSLIS
jgi:chromosome segregation ATPase